MNNEHMPQHINNINRVYTINNMYGINNNRFYVIIYRGTVLDPKTIVAAAGLLELSFG
jgi:hypothetical protein